MDVVIREIEAKGIMTKSNLPIGGYSVNPYLGCTHACRYCYACFMKRFNKHDEPWGQFLDVKTWPRIRNPRRYAGQRVFIGSVTDPYLPQEEEFRRTRAVLEQLRGSGARVSIATKSDLVLRDLDLIAEFPGARVSWSVNTLDEAFRADMDSASPIERRLAAMEAFHDAGVRTTCFISPIFPGVTDVAAIIRRTKGICNLVWLEDLNLRGGFKGDIMGYIAERRPELLALYQGIYNKGDRSYWDGLDAEVRALCEELGLPYAVNDDSDERPLDAPPLVVNYFDHGKIRGATAKGAERAR
ncbi:MAG: radical SAM mobile pair protein B [Atopobiaceae bacterium]|nr:radical SAM mobile pair protein B [Atopobiaceae bacterium]